MKPIGAVAAICLVSTVAFAGSISSHSVRLERAAWMAKRIVVGKVIEKTRFRYPGSKDFATQDMAHALHVFRIKATRTLKGPAFPKGGELNVFSGSEWFAHTHAVVIKAGVISYADTRYTGGVESGRIKAGMEILFFLDDEPAPVGFPAGSVFMPFWEAHDRGDRAGKVIAALKEGAFGDFDHLVDLKIGNRIRFPDGLQIELLGHSHKRPTLDGPRRESTELALVLGGRREMIQLGHVTEKGAQDSWDTKRWNQYTIELRAMAYDERSTVVVRKN